MKLSELELHHNLLESLWINPKKNSISIKAEVWENDIPDTVDILFEQTENLETDGINWIGEVKIEIYSCRVRETDAGLEIHIILLTGFGKPCVDIRFRCKHYSISKVDNGLQTG